MSTKTNQIAFNNLLKQNITVSDTVLDTTIDFIKATLNPDNVFSEIALISHIQGNYLPQDVFKITDLEIWAESVGYSKK